MNYFNSIIILIGKIASFLLRTFRFGAGATWPGEIALRFSPRIFQHLAGRFRKGIIYVVGTNGKTTTAAMIANIIRSEGYTVVQNNSGANLLNGVVSACIVDGSNTDDYGVFEVDENSLPLVMKYSDPVMVVVLNLFRDQLDRYGEVDVIAEKWKTCLKSLRPNSTLILNADDPLVASFGQQTDCRHAYFGLTEKFKQNRSIDHATDSIFCEYCGGRLAYTSYFFSHLGDWYCPACGRKRPDTDISIWDSPLPGLYNTYNTIAAVLAARQLDIADQQIAKALAGFTPAFGRQEEFSVRGRTVKLFLSKNPAGFNASLRAVLDMHPKTVLLALNDRIPDGRDVSWIWDVDFELIPQIVSVVVSGDRVYDLALRITYSVPAQSGRQGKLVVEPELSKAIHHGIDQTESGGTLYVLATYSAMLEVRKCITGRKIL